METTSHMLGSDGVGSASAATVWLFSNQGHRCLTDFTASRETDEGESRGMMDSCLLSSIMSSR